MSVSIPTVTLQNGRKMPLFILGTYKFKNLDQPGDLQNALNLGYRHIDTAKFYQNEHYCGQEINNFLAEQAKNNSKNPITREDLFITTKLDTHNNIQGKVIAACKSQLQDMNLDYFDLYLVHAPWCTDATTGEYVNNDLVAMWHVMEELVNLGLCKSIGVSNFSFQQCQNLVQNCRQHQPQVNQIESHIWFHNNQLLADLKSINIHMSAYTVLGRWDRIHNHHLENPKTPMLEDKLLVELAKKYSVTASELAIKFQIQRGVSAIVKAQSNNNQNNNLNIFKDDLKNFKISEEDYNKIYNLPQVRGLTYDASKGHVNYPGYTIDN